MDHQFDVLGAQKWSCLSRVRACIVLVKSDPSWADGFLNLLEDNWQTNDLYHSELIVLRDTVAAYPGFSKKPNFFVREQLLLFDSSHISQNSRLQFTMQYLMYGGITSG